MSQAIRRDEKVTFRISKSEYALLNQAASLQADGNVSRFLYEVAIPRARSVVEESGIAFVTDENRETFYQALLNPPAPTGALYRLFHEADADGVVLIEE